jgi:hypothetical protein
MCKILLASRKRVREVAGKMVNYWSEASRSLLEDRHGMRESIKRLDEAELKALEDRHKMRELIKRLEERLAKSEAELKAEITNNKADLEALQSHIQTLTHRRFFKACRLDALGNTQGLESIGVICGGDAVADASFYTSEERYDYDTLTQLYGQSAEQIAYLGKYHLYYIVAS